MAKNPIEHMNELIEKFDHMKKQDKVDLSSDQDLTFAIMNLVSIEEHLIFTGAKTQKNSYYDLVNEVRNLRRDLMKRVVREPEGEIWCISKHLLATCMRLMEVGNKQLGLGRQDVAYDYFQKAYDVYALFWGIQMGVIDSGQLSNMASSDDSTVLQEARATPSEVNTSANTTPLEISTGEGGAANGLMSKLGGLVKKVIDCCIE